MSESELTEMWRNRALALETTLRELLAEMKLGDDAGRLQAAYERARRVVDEEPKSKRTIIDHETRSVAP